MDSSQASDCDATSAAMGLSLANKNWACFADFVVTVKIAIRCGSKLMKVLYEELWNFDI